MFSNLCDHWKTFQFPAVGCVLPPLQSRVELEYQSEDIAKYVCAENHVFPDTSLPQRVLQCINDSWNDTLVNCFREYNFSAMIWRFIGWLSHCILINLSLVNLSFQDQESFESGPIHLLHNARLRKEKTMGSNDENFDGEKIVFREFIEPGLSGLS